MTESREQRLYDLVQRIATDQVEFSDEKARCQRDDYRRWCRKLLEELRVCGDDGGSRRSVKPFLRG